MLKKIILAALLIGFTGALIWGGVNRTLAKTNESEGRNANNQNIEHIENEDGNGEQQRGNGNQAQGNYSQNQSDDDQPHENLNEQINPVSQGQGNGNGFQVDPVMENAAASTDSSVNSNSGSGENQAQGNGNRGGRGNGNGQGGGYVPLTETEIKALNMALDDEYHALAVYQSVIASFGEVEPFVEIAASEQRHIDALVNQFNKQGLPIPENSWMGSIPPFDSVQQACQAGVEAEIANADLYSQLFAMTENPTLTRVFTNLSNASVNSHLPQFETCQ